MESWEVTWLAEQLVLVLVRLSRSSLMLDRSIVSEQRSAIEMVGSTGKWQVLH